MKNKFEAALLNNPYVQIEVKILMTELYLVTYFDCIKYVIDNRN